MPEEGWADNCLVLAGRVAVPGRMRYSPAGLPMVRFVLEHESQRREAGIARRVRCRVLVLACGEALALLAGRLAADTRIRVRGFLSRADYRQGAARLVLHAEQIETEHHRG